MKIQSLSSNGEVFFEMMYNSKEGTSFRDFIGLIQEKAKLITVEQINENTDIAEINRLNRQCEDKRLKFKGDCLEIFAELFFTAFQNDPSVGLIDYMPVDIQNDYGVDATGYNANGDKVAVQVKFRSNPFESVTYEELAKTYVAARKLESIDVDINNSIFVFTTANDVTNSCEKMFGPTLVKVTYNIIDRYVTNNKSFWRNSFDHVYHHLNGS